MGTSLKVYPFAGLINSINEKAPLVVINRENPLRFYHNTNLILPGDIQETVQKLVKDCEWEDIFNKLTTKFIL